MLIRLNHSDFAGRCLMRRQRSSDIADQLLSDKSPRVAGYVQDLGFVVATVVTDLHMLSKRWRRSRAIE